MAKPVGPSNPPGGAVLKPYYANAVLVSSGPLLFISGQVAWDEAGSIVGVGDPLAQAVQTFANLRTVLQFHGADFGDLVKVTVYVTSFDWFEELSALREHVHLAGCTADPWRLGPALPAGAWDDLRLVSLKLIFVIVTRGVSLLGLSRREWWWKDAGILMLRHQLAVAERERPGARRVGCSTSGVR